MYVSASISLTCVCVYVSVVVCVVGAVGHAPDASVLHAHHGAACADVSQCRTSLYFLLFMNFIGLVGFEIT